MTATLKELKIGDDLEPRKMSVTQDGINAFHHTFGGSNPLHTDPELAQERGFGAPLQHGVRTLYPVFTAVFSRFPQLAAGASCFSAKFIAPVEPGDELTAHCRVIRHEETGGQRMVAFESWVENQKGTKVLVGEVTLSESLQG